MNFTTCQAAQLFWVLLWESLTPSSTSLYTFHLRDPLVNGHLPIQDSFLCDCRVAFCAIVLIWRLGVGLNGLALDGLKTPTNLNPRKRHVRCGSYCRVVKPQTDDFLPSCCSKKKKSGKTSIFAMVHSSRADPEGFLSRVLGALLWWECSAPTSSEAACPCLGVPSLWVGE